MWVLVLDELGLTRLLKGKCFCVYMTTWKISTSLQQICDSSDAELRLPLCSTDFGLKHNWTLTLSSLVSSETVNRPSVRQTGRHLNLNQVRCVLRLLQLQQLETDFLWTSDWRVDFWKTKNLYFHIINSASAHPPGLSGLSAEPCLNWSWQTGASGLSVTWHPPPVSRDALYQIRRFSGSLNVCTVFQFSEGFVSRDIRCLRMCVKRFYWKMSQCSVWEEIWNWRGSYVRWWMPSSYTQHFYSCRGETHCESWQRSSFSISQETKSEPCLETLRLSGLSVGAPCLEFLCDAASLCKQKWDDSRENCCCVVFSPHRGIIVDRGDWNVSTVCSRTCRYFKWTVIVFTANSK